MNTNRATSKLLPSLYKAPKDDAATLHGEKYVDSRTLHPYLTVYYLITRPWALIRCYNSLHASCKAFYRIL